MYSGLYVGIAENLAFIETHLRKSGSGKDPIRVTGGSAQPLALIKIIYYDLLRLLFDNKIPETIIVAPAHW